MKSRYIRTVVFNPNEKSIKSIDPTINLSVDVIKALGGSIVSHFGNTFGFSPINYVYHIVYEREDSISDEEFDKMKAEILAKREKTT